MRRLKTELLRVLTLPMLNAPFAPLTRDRASIFMLHRFDVPDAGVEGHDPAALRETLAYLRRHRYDLVPLGELFRRLHGDGPPLHRAVAFTIDDGYFDHAEIGAPIFREFDCPVTTFVTSGFLDGKIWFWWNRIEYVFAGTARQALEVPLGDRVLHLTRDADGWAAALATFTEACKLVSDDEKHAAIGRLAAAAEVDLPDAAPPQYGPMSWDTLRACEAGGMSFGPHTVTHPVLSRATDQQSRFEIEESWRRLREEARAPVPVFCYPNGGIDDYGTREIETLRRLDFLGAVIGSTGYADASAVRAGDGRFRVPRFTDSENLPRAVQFASGAERLKLLLLGSRA